MLLLCAPISEEKPVTRAGFAGMQKMLDALGTGAFDLERDVEEGDLQRLGLSVETAAELLRRLNAGQTLERYLKNLDRMGITLLTRISPEYPRRLRQILGQRAPMLLYCAGNLELFQTRCMSVVGSRKLRPLGADFARQAGRAIAREGYTYVSGGAIGADNLGHAGARENGGHAILFLPDSLQGRMEKLHAELETGNLLLACEDGFDVPFSPARAYARNRLIHAMGEKVFVAQSGCGEGGTWAGVEENLKHRWSPVFMCNAEPEESGTRGLMAQGCVPILTEELHNLGDLGAEQTTLF